MQSDIWFVIAIIFFVVAFILLVAFIWSFATRVDPNNCAKTVSTFGVIPGATGQVIFLCGKDGTQACEADAKTLTEAVEFCDARVDICDMFSYDLNTLTMQIISSVDPDSLTNTDSSSNVFIRQN